MNNIIKTTLLLWLSLGVLWAQEVPNTLTPEQKAYELSLIWKEMSYNFDNMNHCPELDMDSLYRAFVPVVMATTDDFEYSKAVMRYLSHFRNNHTFVVDSPSWVDSLSLPNGWWLDCGRTRASVSSASGRRVPRATRISSTCPRV